MKHRFLAWALILTTAAPLFAAPEQGPAGAPARGGGLLAIAPWILIFGIFYFLLIRPQQRQAKEQKKMLDSIKRGDRILTQGGIFATVSTVKGKTLEVKLNNEVKVLIARSAVASVVLEDPALEPEVLPKVS